MGVSIINFISDFPISILNLILKEYILVCNRIIYALNSRRDKPFQAQWVTIVENVQKKHGHIFKTLWGLMLSSLHTVCVSFYGLHQSLKQLPQQAHIKG